MRSAKMEYDTLNPYILKHLRQLCGKRVLDIGCSTGRLGAALRLQANEVYGIEFDRGSAEKASAVLDKVIVGDVESLKLPFRPAFFDAVVLGDVLEHLRSPASVLERIRPLLKDDGILVLSVPNIANWLVRLKLLFGIFDYSSAGIMDSSHLRFFTLKSLARLVKASGFAIRKMDIYPSFPPFFMRFAALRGAAHFISSLRKQLFAFQFVVVGGKL
jgi:2-polyprenyl-3-methyl-5-hydroxy-6-metoxy-1,4-benzoquinol methylase